MACYTVSIPCCQKGIYLLELQQQFPAVEFKIMLLAVCNPVGQVRLFCLGLQGYDLRFRIHQELDIFRVIQQAQGLPVDPYPLFLQVQG